MRAEFDSLTGRQTNRIEAQVVEQEPFKLKEVGSIPTGPTKTMGL